ncbi:MAG: acyl carrier protein [Chloroflexota bacterium]
MALSTLDEVRRVISRVARCSEEEITMELPLQDVKADSLHWVQIVVGVENAFDIEIDVDRMREFSTIGDFVKYIESLAA